MALDPEFALAFAQTSTSYINLRSLARAREFATRAFELRKRVSERERFYIEARYHDSVTGDTDEVSKSVPAVGRDLSTRLHPLEQSWRHLRRPWGSREEPGRLRTVTSSQFSQFARALEHQLHAPGPDIVSTRRSG